MARKGKKKMSITNTLPTPEVKMQSSGWVTVPAAHKATGVPIQTLYRWCERGLLPTKSIVGRKYLELKALKALLQPVPS